MASDSERLSGTKALVVGGGIGGMATAIKLLAMGCDVRLIDLDPEWRVYGAGITITGPTLRALRDLGLMDEFRRNGATSEGLMLFRADGTPIRELTTTALDDDLPHSGGIMRPVLHNMLSTRVRAGGADIRLGLTVETVAQDDSGVDVRFSDGTNDRFDLVVGADGAFSRMRQLLFPDAPAPKFTGQGCWRVMAKRPAHVRTAEFYMGDIKVGLVPCSLDEMYLFALENHAEREWIPNDQLLPRLRNLLDGFGGTVAEVREGLNEDSSIVYRPLEALLLPTPWSKGRIVLIGDAVHSTTPHLASGAGIALEDAMVLAEELAAAPSIGDAFTAFETRRFERCRLVVENSVRLGEIEMEHGDVAEHSALMERSMIALAEPI